MKKVHWIGAGCVALLAVCIVYFYPISLAGNIMETSKPVVLINEIGVHDGEPYINTKNYDQITEEEKQKVMEIVQEYSYRRTLTTYGSSNAMENAGNKTVFLYLYEGDILAKSIYVSDSGQISVDNRIYKMKHTDQFVKEIEEIFQ